MKEADTQKHHITEKKILLRWLNGRTRKDRIKSESSSELSSLNPTEVERRTHRFQWYDHAERTKNEEPTGAPQGIEIHRKSRAEQLVEIEKKWYES